ncbi:hypothetical protein D0T12_25035 [Actinomadura spongiicola]|uniref:DUF6777 domain-containing protein n=1 Tax=Actinomadura spongiicola TaxID=2303421 RepID=A0A372GBI2_9ACTN|nr:DUF6777 domain-containing protein [Actinomadura spongiicola]RFS82710.1 hypothetical protein D0T12_25035 [Actinomadura spongiicola]
MGAVVGLALVAGGLSGCGDAGATITRLTVGTPGPDPYTRMANTDEPAVKKRPRAGGTQVGDSPGLYGGTRRAATCDQGRLAAFLQANPAKARAWAGVHGIPVKDVARYVSRLTPVLLRTDTLVTNHGYRDGKATSGPAVLQAGMGVLVNGYGVPVVKCNCGNPLTRPEKKISVRSATYTGRSWPGFTKEKVTKVRPRDTGKGPIVTFVLVDPEARMGFQRPRASGGEADGPPIELPSTETEAPVSDSPAPTDSGSESPGTGTPGMESPDTETPDTGTPGDGTPDPGMSPASPGVPSEGPGTGTGDGSGTGDPGGGDPGGGGGGAAPGGPSEGTVSLPPPTPPSTEPGAPVI